MNQDIRLKPAVWAPLLTIAALLTGCRAPGPEPAAKQALDLSSYYLPNAEAAKVVSVITNTPAPATVLVQTHAIAIKESGPKETVARFGEVYTFAPDFFVVHRDEPTLIRFWNLQADDYHDFMLFNPRRAFLKILLPPLQETAYTFTFHEEGLFNFICAMHQPAMSGQILVLPPRPASR